MKLDWNQAEAMLEISKELSEVLDKTAEAVAEDARSEAPVSTGKLRDSIHVESEGNTRRIGTDVDYAVYLETGTSTSPPKPFLTPAMQRAEIKK